jgi:hypothetical protein
VKRLNSAKDVGEWHRTGFEPVTFSGFVMLLGWR